MTDKISISVPDTSLLKWAQEEARRTGVSLSAVIAVALHRARQASARARVLEWLGDAAELSAKREAEILGEWGGGERTKKSSGNAGAPKKASPRRRAQPASEPSGRVRRVAR